MPLQIDDSKATRHFFAQTVRICPGCGEEQRYDYKSNGHYFYHLSGLQYLAGQIVYCHNGGCRLRYKPMHPPEELERVPPRKGHGFDVIARIGKLRYREKLTRSEIWTRLAKDHPALVISPRQIENLYKFYAALVSVSTLSDPDIIAAIKANKCMVLSFDGGKPIRDNDSVWFVRDLMSGITLAALPMTSCTTEALVDMLTPIKVFARRHNTPVIAIVSDKESKNLAAARKVFPKARHQYCQVHYVGNLAEPVAKVDRELRNDVKEAMRGKVGEIEKAIKQGHGGKKSLKADEGDVLLDLCAGIRSLLRRNGKQPYHPPGIRLVKDLIELRESVRQMKREKGGPTIRRSTIFCHSPRSSKGGNARSDVSTRTSGAWGTFSSPILRRRRKAPSACFKSCARPGRTGF